jgi:hypothetical protein
MITFASLNTIISDILSISRGAKISQSEPISRRQVEYWVHQYRALLIKQDLDKGKVTNPDYIQEIPSIKLELVQPSSPESPVNGTTYLYRTKIDIPKTLDLNHDNGFTYIGTINGDEIQFVSQGRIDLQKYKKYTSRDIQAYLKDNRIYVLSPYSLSYIQVRGIFEVPTEIYYIVNDVTIREEYNVDMPYPIPLNMIVPLKEMILKKEISIELSTLSDTKNDSQSSVATNVDQANPKQ